MKKRTLLHACVYEIARAERGKKRTNEREREKKSISEKKKINNFYVRQKHACLKNILAMCQKFFFSFRIFLFFLLAFFPFFEEILRVSIFSPSTLSLSLFLFFQLLFIFMLLLSFFIFSWEMDEEVFLLLLLLSHTHTHSFHHKISMLGLEKESRRKEQRASERASEMKMYLWNDGNNKLNEAAPAAKQIYVN